MQTLQKNANCDSSRKNLMGQSMDPTEVLKKREEFAVSLRKKKQRELIQQKRKKMTERLAATNLFGDQQPAAAASANDVPIHLKVYKGFPEWKYKDKNA